MSDKMMEVHLHQIITSSNLHHIPDIPDDDSNIIVVTCSKRQQQLTSADLARMWKVGIETARRTLQSTTHECLQTTESLYRRFCTDVAHHQYKSLSTLHGDFYCDVLKMSVTSVHGFTCGNLFCN